MYFSNIDYLKNNDFYKPMFLSMEQEIETFNKYYNDDSRFLSGWGHNYFCNEDGGKLIYDIKTPESHKCSICGKVYRGFNFDSVYITFLRNESVVSTIKSAILYKISGDSKHLDFIKKIVEFYADNYDRFAIHSKEVISKDITFDVGGAGKIMPQGLNEAIIAIRLINALEIVKDNLSKEWLLKIKESLFGKVYALLKPQKNHIHNIPCWINSAIGVMGFFFQDQNWIDEATINNFNINEQIEKGVTENGFWYEGSIHYNFFALEGIMNFLVFAKTYNHKTLKTSEDTIFKMIDAAYYYAFDNDIFPNPSDGWPNIGLKTYSYVYYMAYKVFGDKVLPYIKHIENNTNARPKLPLTEPYYYENKIALERLLFLPNLDEFKEENLKDRKSMNFEAYNCCILRNQNTNVFLKYGHQTISHAHPDKMNIEIMISDKILLKDLSNSGYGSKLCNNWHRKNASHNTCMVNFQESDIESSGKILNFSDNLVEAKNTPYENVEYIRKIELDSDLITDNFKVICKNISNIDFFLHLEIEVDLENLILEKTDSITQYDYILDQQKIIAKDFLTIKTSLADIQIKLEEGSDIFITKTYNNPANTMRNTIIIRKKDTNAEFNTVYKIK